MESSRSAVLRRIQRLCPGSVGDVLRATTYLGWRGERHTCHLRVISNLAQHPHFTNEESEAQKGELTYLQSRSEFVVERARLLVS